MCPQALEIGMENGVETASAEDALGDGDGITGLYCIGLDWTRLPFEIGSEALFGSGAFRGTSHVMALGVLRHYTIRFAFARRACC